ncbi:hypothetical protein AVEN_119165-1 [Araneus ventricosus]|uniref:Helitron helicase-like domain-containing protein n=1 Tax=Araneus ventricosus TaxID=182803 RepID=A0A4Y2PWH1_ARAVE|nr:hypothetical protein AVEN_119165-1 [Araneus ventricosus]
MAIARASETVEERCRRQAANAQRTATARASENTEERCRRQAADAQRISNSSNICYESDPLIAIGRMTLECNFCQVLRWKGESPGMCCSNGKIRLHSLQAPPEHLYTLLTADYSDAVHFQDNVRKYNACFQMTSFGSTKEIREAGFMPTFKVQGQVYHRIGSLQPLRNEEPKFLQIYFVGDKDKQIEQRCRNISNTRPSIVSQIQDMLHQHNSYVKSFKYAMEKMSPELKVVIYADKTPSGQHERRYNAPETSEVAIILAGDKQGSGDISLELRSNRMKKIAETHRAYDALQYPLLFWQGEDGYNFELRQTNPTGEITTKKISAMDFYA